MDFRKTVACGCMHKYVETTSNKVQTKHINVNQSVNLLAFQFVYKSGDKAAVLNDILMRYTNIYL